MLDYCTAQSEDDLLGILSLQHRNHFNELKDIDQGFLFVKHDLDMLQSMNSCSPQVIVKDQEKVIAYVLSMVKQSEFFVPALRPMFELFGKLKYRGRLVSDWNYVVVGQVCVDSAFRGRGIFETAYQAFRQQFEKDFDFVITEVSKRNPRSLRAHEKIGFKEIYSYTDPTGEFWSIVVWDMKHSIVV